MDEELPGSSHRADDFGDPATTVVVTVVSAALDGCGGLLLLAQAWVVVEIPNFPSDIHPSANYLCLQSMWADLSPVSASHMAQCTFRWERAGEVGFDGGCPHHSLHAILKACVSHWRLGIDEVPKLDMR